MLNVAITARDCGQFPSPSNGAVVGNKTTFRSILTFVCDFGYEISGSSIIECQADGNWSSPITSVQCIGKTRTTNSI